MPKQKVGAQAVSLISITQALFAAESRSFRRAAKTLGIRQSVVSRRVRALEQLLGVKLFDRHYGGVRVTAAGARFFQQARDVLLHLEYAVKAAGAAGRGPAGRLNVGILSSMADGFLRELIQTYLVNHPDVAIQIVEGTPSDHIALVRKRCLDVAFILDTVDIKDCDVIPLWSERLFAVLPVRHALSRKKEIEWQALRDENLIIRTAERGPVLCERINKLLSDPDHRPKLQKLDVGRETMMHLVAMGLGVSLTSEATIAVPFPEVTFRPIAGSDEMLKFCAVWSRTNDNPALRRLLSLARILARKKKLYPGNGRRAAIARSTVTRGFNALVLSGRSLAVRRLPVPRFA
jgi:DNA-binding transcriptional LysR family regulator